MGWLIGLGVVLLILFFPLRIRVIYNASGLFAWLNIGPFRYWVYPEKESPEEKKQEGKKKESFGELDGLLQKLREVWELLDFLRQKLTIRILKVRLRLAGDDPYTLSLNYGRTWAAAGNLIPWLEEIFHIKKRDVDISCDYNGESNVLFMKLDIYLTVARLIALLAGYAKLINNRKGGTKQ